MSQSPYQSKQNHNPEAFTASPAGRAPALEPSSDRTDGNSVVPDPADGGGATRVGGQAEPAASTFRQAKVGHSVKAEAESPMNQLAFDLIRFDALSDRLRQELDPKPQFEARRRQAFELANDLFGHAPTWVCFYRALWGGEGLIPKLFRDQEEFGQFLRTEEHYQIQLMLTALRSRELPETDPNDPQRMITVRLPKSLHKAICDEAKRLNISVNRLCISRLLQSLDPAMIPELHSKPRGRKPRDTE